MSYPTRTRVPPAQYTPGQGSSYGPSTPSLLLNGVNGSRSNSPYPSRNTNVSYTPTRPGPRGPGRPPINRDLPPSSSQQPNLSQAPYANGTPQAPTYHRPATLPPGPLPFFTPPPGQPTRDPTYPPPISQGIYTTYPSRLRTGVTGLVQPETITGGPREREQLLAELDRELAIGRSGSGTATPRIDSPAPFGASRRAVASTGATRARGRGAVNYAEKGSDDEDEEEEEESELSDVQEAASDPDDTDYGRAGRRKADRDRSGGGGGGGKPFSQMGVAEQQATVRARKLKKKQEDAERGWTWLGDRAPAERVKTQAHKGTKHPYATEEALAREADKPESLVPITIDIDVTSNHPDLTGIKIKDRFLWNINETFLTPQQFSIVFCDDLGISSQQYAPIVAELIQNQLEETGGMMDIDVADPDCTDTDVVWSEDEVEEQTVNGPPTTNGTGDAVPVIENGDEAEVQEDEAEPEQVTKVENWTEADCRIIVNLDVQIYEYLLRDRIEWDLSSSLPPTLFAKEYCRELGLTGEAIPLVAHAITDELLKHKRDALELELFASTHPEEQAKWDRTYGATKVNSRYGARGLVGVWRDWWEREEFGPVLIELSTEDMERREVERTREARRMMRTLATNKRRR